jgi:hypothetical protein
VSAVLEWSAKQAWQAWGAAYALFTTCDRCGKRRYCRGKVRRYVLCLECFDLGPEGEDR